MRVFDLENGKRPISVVAGLTWHPLVPDNFKRELKPLSIDLAADLYVYRKSNKSMVGFAKSEDGAKAGQIPIALAIAQCLDEESEPTNALVAVEVPDSNASGEPAYLYVLIRDGFILADGDQVGNEDQIRTRYLSDLSVSGWDLLIAPEHWKVNKATSRDLMSFLPKKNSKIKIPTSWKLKPVNVSIKSAIITTVLIAVLATVGYVGLDHWKKAEAAKLKAQIAAQQAAAEDAARQKNLLREPWQDLPRASLFMSSCNSALRRVGVTAGNWSMGGFVCENGLLTIKWERAGGSALVSHLKAMYPNAVLSSDGASATVTSRVLMPAPTVKTGEILQTVETRTEAFRDAKLRYGIAVWLPTKSDAPQSPQPNTPPQAQQMSWTSFDVVAESQLSPHSTVEALDAPGFRITKVEGKLKGGLINYQLKGIQYAKP